MVEDPARYRWTSYRANALGRADRLLTPHEQYRLRREAYRELFKAHLDPEFLTEIRQATNGNFALGSKKFQAQIEAALGRRAVRGVAGRPRKNDEAGDDQLRLL
jgi:putative transposase